MALYKVKKAQYDDEVQEYKLALNKWQVEMDQYNEQAKETVRAKLFKRLAELE